MKEKVKSNKKFKLGGSELHTNVMKISSIHKEMHTNAYGTFLSA